MKSERGGKNLPCPKKIFKKIFEYVGLTVFDPDSDMALVLSTLIFPYQVTRDRMKGIKNLKKWLHHPLNGKGLFPCYKMGMVIRFRWSEVKLYA